MRRTARYREFESHLLRKSAILIHMAQVIDLRKKEEFVVPPPPAEAEPVVAELSATEEVIEADPSRWVAHLTPGASRERTWYVIGVLIIGAILAGVFFHDIMFTFVLALGALVLALHSAKPHRPSAIGIHATGISIDGDHHRFSDMRSFWIHYYPPHIKELSVEFKKGLTHRIHIPLENQNPLEIRQVMVNYVPEKEHEPSLLDHLVRII